MLHNVGTVMVTVISCIFYTRLNPVEIKAGNVGG